MREIEKNVVYSRAELAGRGWSGSAVDRAARSGRILRLRQGMYAIPPSGHHLLSVAAVRACHNSVLSHRSAALLHGLTLLGPSPTLPEITVPPHNGTVLAESHLHRATLDPCDVVEVQGIPVTNVARTLVDLARRQSRRASVVAYDSALHHRTVDEDALYEVALRCGTWPGIRRALRALMASDSRAESPLESISRLTLAWLGLPVAEPQVIVRDLTGRFVARCDFGWPRSGVLGECDGLMKYTDPQVLQAEKLRQESIEQLGLVVVRWTWADITQQPFQVESRIRQAFERAAALRRSGFVVAASLSSA